MAAPLKVTVRQQGGEVEGREHLKLGSSSKTFVFQLKNNQPVVGRMKGSISKVAFRDGSYPFRSTSHLLPDLMQNKGIVILVFPPEQQNFVILWHFS